MQNPDSVQGWLQLVRQHETAALALVDSKTAAAQAYFHVGMAVECALKAYIMRKERWNAWPSKEAREDLYTHDLRLLKQMAGIDVKQTDTTAPAWHVMLQADRQQNYNPKPMPRKVARSLFDAAFCDEGVVTWIRQKLG